MTIHNKETLERDFSRSVWCLLGLPFDAVDMKQAVEIVKQAIDSHSPCFLSTPNLNFLCAAQTDEAFKQSVINSELSVADGFPIILLARLLRIPLPERVAGSDLIDYLQQSKTDKPIKVFFFGGSEGAGEMACQKINHASSGITAVGYYTPGFGSIDDMSSEAIIRQINQSECDFLIVALGAKKGQAWIEKNRSRLNATVISHLGAVINFFAGTVIRAPKVYQRFGLEWLWRIYQEPQLWLRYYEDGVHFLKLCFFYAIPYWLWMIQNRKLLKSEIPCRIKIEKSLDDTTQIILSGHCVDKTITMLRDELKGLVLDKKNVSIDLSEVDVIDGAFIGLIFILFKHLSLSNNTLYLVTPKKSVESILKWNRVDFFHHKN